MEGYPLAKQGRGGAALEVSVLAGFMGGTVALVCLAFFAPRLTDLALTFGPFEYLALMLFSLSCAAGLGGRSVLKGLASAFVGLLIAAVGVDTHTTVYRFTFGSNQLLQGFDVVAIVVGLFGITEVLTGVLETSASGAGERRGFSSFMPNRRELKLGARAAAGGSVIGTAMGILPGITPSVASFITYSVTKRFAVEKEKFGKGAIEGCAGPEAADNAAAIAGFIPLMALGIPTGPVLAIVLAALIIQGVVPGPLMFTVNQALSGTVIAAFFISNLMLVILNIPLSGIWVKIANLPYRWLAPMILFLCVLGSAVRRNATFDLWIMLAFGLLGFAAKKNGFPLPPLVLGIILGRRLETYFRQTVVLGWDYLFTRPFAIAIVLLAVLMMFLFSRFKGRLAED